MPLDTPVPERFQEQFEQAVRDVLGGISQTDLDVSRELPPPRQRDALELECAPELDALTVASVPAERVLGVTLYFGEPPDGTVAVVPDGVADPARDVPPRGRERSPTYLGELGDGYADLSTALVGTLAAYCDAPEHAPERAFVGERADLLCTRRHDGVVRFSASLAYPGYVEEVYTEGRADAARRLGLPF